jgi:hypothetical protein
VIENHVRVRVIVLRAFEMRGRLEKARISRARSHTCSLEGTDVPTLPHLAADK